MLTPLANQAPVAHGPQDLADAQQPDGVGGGPATTLIVSPTPLRPLGGGVARDLARTPSPTPSEVHVLQMKRFYSLPPPREWLKAFHKKNLRER